MLIINYYKIIEKTKILKNINDNSIYEIFVL